jgi:hypothetical protein
MATEKQKRAIRNVVENGGNVSKAMRDAGYSPNTAHTPQKLTESDAWREIMDRVLPDDLLAEKHAALLNKKEVKRTFDHDAGEWIDAETGDVDTQAVSKGLDMAYKLKGKYSPTKVSFTDPYEELDDDALLAELAKRHSDGGAAQDIQG